MNIFEFVNNEEGSISVDWAVMAAAVTAVSLAAAGLLSSGIGGFTSYNARDLAIQAKGGNAHHDTGSYVPQDEALYEAYLEGLSGLELDQLDALAGFANRLDAGNIETAETEDETGMACNAGQGAGYGIGYCNNQNASYGVSVSDFLMAVDHEYTLRGVGKPAHLHIDGAELGVAFEKMGLSQQDIRTLLQS